MKKILFCLVFSLFSVQVFATNLHDDGARYDDGARWAFISDKNSTSVAVVDTFEYKHVDNLQLKAIPVQMAVSDVQDILVYIDGKTTNIYIYDLVKNTHSTMVLKSVPTDMIFHSDGAQLAVASQNRIDIIQPLQGKFGDVIDDLNSPFSMNFDNGGYNLYATEAQTGKTLIYRTHDGKQQFVQMGQGKVSAITLSPDARLALVSQYQSNSVYIWDLFMEEHFATVTMTDKPWRPYVSSDSEHIIVIANDGKGAVINAWSGEEVRQLQLPVKPTSIRTGWLESIGIIESATNLAIFDLGNDKPILNVPLIKPLLELVVVSDSKTLFATQQGSSDLMVFDIRSQQSKAPINTGLTHPNLLVMGITNTVCH